MRDIPEFKKLLAEFTEKIQEARKHIQVCVHRREVVVSRAVEGAEEGLYPVDQSARRVFSGANTRRKPTVVLSCAFGVISFTAILSLLDSDHFH